MISQKTTKMIKSGRNMWHRNSEKKKKSRACVTSALKSWPRMQQKLARTWN